MKATYQSVSDEKHWKTIEIENAFVKAIAALEEVTGWHCLFYVLHSKEH